MNENIIGFKELGILAKKYGFNNILDFSVWVEDNNLAEALGIKGEDEEETENIIGNLEQEDKDSLKYNAKVLALEILALPEFQEEIKKLKCSKKSIKSIPLEKYDEWARKVRENRRNSGTMENK